MNTPVTPLEIGPPPTDRPFLIRAKDEMGAFDFGSHCVVIDGKVCTKKFRKPIKPEVIGWREVPNV